MKILKAFLFLGFLFISLLVNAQTPIDASKVPTEVSREFQKRFPLVSNPAWSQLGDEFIATFDQNNTKVSYVMAFSGRWLRTETESAFNELPRIAQKYITTNYNDFAKDRIVFIQDKDKAEYLVSLTKDSKKVSLRFDNSGNIVSTPVNNNAQVQNNTENNGTNPSNTQQVQNSKQPINVKELPSNITSDIMINYPDFSVSEAYFINNEMFTNTYYLICKNESGEKSIELWYDFSGKMIKNSDGGLGENGGEKGKKDKSSKGEKLDKGKKGKNVRRPVPESMVPVAAVDFFKKKEPKAESVRWDTISAYYVVSFYNPAKSEDCKMFFSQKGVWDYTSIQQNTSQLNPMVGKYMEENYSKFEIESIENIVKSDKKKFILIKVFDPAWVNDPMVYTELYFNSSGKLEKEIIADGIDGYDLDEKKRKEEYDAYFNEYLDADDNNLNEGEMVDGQIVLRKELPTKANNYIVDNYKGYRFVESIIVSDEGKLFYSVFIKKEGVKEKIRLLFDAKGNFISEEKL